MRTEVVNLATLAGNDAIGSIKFRVSCRLGRYISDVCTKSHALPCGSKKHHRSPRAHMATKRSASHVHPSRQDQVPEEPRRKRQKPDNAGPKSFKKAHPVNELKGQVRSLKRLLERNDGMPATVRVEKERALQTARHELQQAEKGKKRSEMIGKYHKIRFFDRQKATKRLKRVQKDVLAFEGDRAERERLEQAVEDAKVDVSYAQYFPLDQPYVSLFPRTSEDDDEDGSEGQAGSERKGDTAMRQKVKDCMANGTLDALRNGKLQRDETDLEGNHESIIVAREEVRPSKKDGSTLSRSARKTRDNEHETHENGDESDGGFFE